MPFLTALDPHMAVKGSRDPLGIQAVWSRFGRHIVGNLTLASTSVRDFTVMLLGHYFIERASEERGATEPVPMFLRWEQLAAYARASVNGETGFRGTDRVKAALSGSERRLTLSAERRHQILSNQKTYGLWGLYTNPSRASSFLDSEPVRLSPVARDFVEREYMPRLTAFGLHKGRSLVALLQENTKRLDRQGAQDKKVLEAVASLLVPQLTPTEREFYRDHLLHGGPADRTGGLQRQFADLLAPTLTDDDFAFAPATMVPLIKTAGRSGADELADRLERVRMCESVLAPAAILFAFLLAFDGETPERLAKIVREAWGDRLRTIDMDGVYGLRAELVAATGSQEAGERWVELGEALAGGHYEQALHLLLAQNQHVMASRGSGAPWAEVRDGRLHVRVRDENGYLPKRDELTQLWRFPYFLDSLRQVARAIEVA